jgi:hypothetical protein
MNWQTEAVVGIAVVGGLFVVAKYGRTSSTGIATLQPNPQSVAALAQAGQLEAQQNTNYLTTMAQTGAATALQLAQDTTQIRLGQISSEQNQNINSQNVGSAQNIATIQANAAQILAQIEANAGITTTSLTDTANTAIAGSQATAAQAIAQTQATTAENIAQTQSNGLVNAIKAGQPSVLQQVGGFFQSLAQGASSILPFLRAPSVPNFGPTGAPFGTGFSMASGAAPGAT